MTEAVDRPFADLPAALVEEVLDRTQDVATVLLDTFNDLKMQRHARRTQLGDKNLLEHESNLEYVPVPTTCGVDGSYAVERLLASDLVAAAAVAVEGVTPPSETRHWPEPRHRVWIDSESHSESTASIVRAIAVGMELLLAAQAPHEVVFLDGSMTTPLIFLNQALNQASQTPHLKAAQLLLSNIVEFLKAYQIILKALRSDKCWIAIPKYTTRREIGTRLGWSTALDDRGALTSVLQPGEFTHPIKLEQPKQPWHLNTRAIPSAQTAEVSSVVNEVVQALYDIFVLYYRPYPWLPALRIEVPQAVAGTPGRLASVIHAIKHQCGAAAMMEPYPLYMADRMVKSLARAIPTFRQVTSQHMAETYEGDISEIFFNLHGYRTESGRQ